jgi:hypothetical protein
MAQERGPGRGNEYEHTICGHRIDDDTPLPINGEGGVGQKIDDVRQLPQVRNQILFGLPEL